MCALVAFPSAGRHVAFQILFIFSPSGGLTEDIAIGADHIPVLVAYNLFTLRAERVLTMRKHPQSQRQRRSAKC